MICRVCKNKCKKIYASNNLPECIWPTKKKNTFSKCHIYSCSKCFHLQLQDFSKKKISSFYGEIKYNLSKSSIHKHRINIIKDNYKSFSLKNKKILDVGGGINPILFGKNIFVADFKVDKEIKLLFKKKYFELDIENKPVALKFDYIFLMHTLEHLKYPLKALKNISKSMKSNSKLFIEIPNFDFHTRKNAYYGIFHQHLNMFTLKHLRNLLNYSGMKIEKLFIDKSVIFCSVIKKETKKNKLEFIDNVKIFKRYEKNYNLMKIKISNHVKDDKFNIYGAGGSMVLALASIKKKNMRINEIFDNDPKKWDKHFPGFKKKILKKQKNMIYKKEVSLSSYDIKNKNNLNINKI
jgi:SAM-dependent methyltransferase